MNIALVNLDLVEMQFLAAGELQADIAGGGGFYRDDERFAVDAAKAVAGLVVQFVPGFCIG